MKRLFLALSCCAALALAAYAQETSERNPNCADKGPVKAAKQGEAETPPAAGPDSGTAPGGSGSSGWTGGMGGSMIGTSPSEETEESPQDQPAVATGLDPIEGGGAVAQQKPPATPTDC